MPGVGGQTITYDYYQEGTGNGFNQINYKLHEPGIYDGGLITKVDETHVEISPLTAYITDSTNELGIRVQTDYSLGGVGTVKVTVSGLPANEVYLILRFAWSDIEDNWVEFLAVPYASILSTDVIIGRCVFNGATLLTTFDYTRRTVPSYLTNKSIFVDSFKVTPTEPPSLTVDISAGACFVDGKYLEVLAGSVALSDISAGGAGNAKYDIIYVNTSGAFAVLAGSIGNPAVIPDFGDGEIGYPVALIYREVDDGTGATVTGRDITQITGQSSNKKYLESYTNTVGLGLNSYYNYGWKFKEGTGVYGGYITYETNYGGISMYTSTSTGNAGGAITGRRLLYLDNRYNNIILGVNTLYNVPYTFGDHNVCIGDSAGKGKSGVSVLIKDNICIGKYSGFFIYDGAKDNIFIGTCSGYGNLSSENKGTYNIGIGYNSLAGIYTGTNNIAIGYNSLVNLTSGIKNVCMGDQAGTYLKGKSNNIFIGDRAGKGDLTYGAGESNICIGKSSGYRLSTGVGGTGGGFNILIGEDAGYYITTGVSNICIGYNTGGAAIDVLDNVIVIGNNLSIPEGASSGSTFMLLREVATSGNPVVRYSLVSHEIYVDTTP